LNREDLISEVHLNSLKADFREECCGCDLNYDSDFEAIKQEVSKSDGIDYNLIEEKAYYILSQKSKDIRVFSYLALCYLRKGDWCLFSDLFEALMYLTKERFDALFPVRLQEKGWHSNGWTRVGLQKCLKPLLFPVLRMSR
jgi:predicted component of type VI protein secretion system